MLHCNFGINYGTEVDKTFALLANHSCPSKPNDLKWCTIVQGVLLLTFRIVHQALFGLFLHYAQLCAMDAPLCYIEPHLRSMVLNSLFRHFQMQGIFEECCLCRTLHNSRKLVKWIILIVPDTPNCNCLHTQ